MKCNCICHFEPKSFMDTGEGKTLGCGTCNFTGKYEVQLWNKKYDAISSMWGMPRKINEACNAVDPDML